MERVPIFPRTNWQAAVKAQGLEWHTPQTERGPATYWNESAYYSFSLAEVEAIERATNDVHELCIVAAQHIIDEDRFGELAIPREFIPEIVRTWNAEPPSLYARFDFSMQGGIPRMLEYNADTPTSLLEASVIQWCWKQDIFPHLDQFNSIHEHLVEKWKDIGTVLPSRLVHFASGNDIEDLWTIGYLAFTAREAGLLSKQMQVNDIGWNAHKNEFRDLDEVAVGTCFKLYPWEWMVAEEFGQRLKNTGVFWIEPMWKMLLSNKGLLPILWELNPGHPNLLEAHFGAPGEAMWGWAKKPLLSREGSNVVIKSAESYVKSPDGGYGEEGFVFQELAPLPVFNDNHAVVGSWTVDGAACGMGVRESDGPITGNLSRFVPHVIRG